MPVTIPDAEPTSAMEVEELLHEPPPIVLDNVVGAPSQNTMVPVIAEGDKFTVTTDVAQQPELNVKVITAVPAATPATTPVVSPTVAIAVLLLLHVPLPVALLNVEVAPVQRFNEPIVGYNVFTVRIFVAAQPVPKV
jgi:hypothetical protein